MKCVLVFAGLNVHLLEGSIFIMVILDIRVTSPFFDLSDQFLNRYPVFFVQGPLESSISRLKC